jgi:glycine/D-amino acid oxidase-like deaminating enzyme
MHGMRPARVASSTKKGDWGKPPWKIDFRPRKRRLPREVDFAIVGGGFTGLATAAWLRHLAPNRSVAVFEASRIGSGSSGHTGGIALGETAAGDLPGLGDVLGGVSGILRTLRVQCDFETGGALELSHATGRADSPLRWADSGALRVAKQVPGGTVNPGKLVSGLARAAERLGAMILEGAGVEEIDHRGGPLRLKLAGGEIRAHRALVATNAMSLELAGLAGRAEPKFTLAVATQPLTESQLRELGLASRRPFYTVDLPYLWGRLLPSNGVIFGSGLVHLEDWRGLERLSIDQGAPAELLTRLSERVRGLHPVLQGVKFTHRWGGPILIGQGWAPVFARHARTEDSLVLGVYSGHGVALSVYLGCWAAEALLGRRELPQWIFDN